MVSGVRHGISVLLTRLTTVCEVFPRWPSVERFGVSLACFRSNGRIRRQESTAIALDRFNGDLGVAVR